MSTRFHRWLFDLFSRDNMRYVCTQRLREGSNGIGLREIYCLCSQYDPYPALAIESTSDLPALEPFVAGLDTVQSALAVAFERYFWHVKILNKFAVDSSDAASNLSVSTSDVESNSSNPALPSRQTRPKYYRGPTHAEKRASTLTSIDMGCALIPLDKQSLRIIEPRNSDLAGPATDQEKTEVITSAVLLLAGEVIQIMQDFECFVRPRLLELHNTYTPSLSHFPEGLERLTIVEQTDWRSSASELLDMFVYQRGEEVFWEACADIGNLFDMS
jgi:hypothetical protein